MKKVLSVLFLSFVAIPVLTVSPAAANNGDEDGNGHRKEEQLTKWNQHLKFGERDRDYRGYWGRRLDGGGPTTPVTGDPTTPGGTGGGQSAPLDGGLTLLLAAGIGLGVKKASNLRKARKENSEIPE